MIDAAYTERRGRIETYFDRTALDAWKQLTSDAPVSRIRATVRHGRSTMRAMLLEWLGNDLRGRRVLDAGCGTGALANEAAARGAQVTAIDISPQLVEIARQRTPADIADRITFDSGDLRDPKLGEFEHVVAMDSLIHYEPADAVAALADLAARTHRSIVFTFPPRTAASAAMHLAGRLFPRGNRAPSIVPVSFKALETRIAAHPALSSWRISRSQSVVSGFYLSQAVELVPR